MLDRILLLFSLAIALAFIFVLLCVVWYIALPIFLVLLAVFFISSLWRSYQIKKTLKQAQAIFEKAVKKRKDKSQVIDVEFKEL